MPALPVLPLPVLPLPVLPLPVLPLLVFALLSVSAQGCAGPGKHDLALAPLVSQHEGTDGRRERDVAWVFWHQRESATERGRGLRPLFFQRWSKDGARSETTYLWPLGRYSVRPGQVDIRLFPLFAYRARYNDLGTIDRDWIVFPTFLFGTDAKEGDYFAFLPFFGTTRSLLGREKMTYGLFPLYVGTEDYGYESTNLLWPFFAVGSGNGRDVFTLFPFYLKRAKEGRYDRRTYLWPFVHVGSDDLEQSDPYDYWSLWPLYGQEISRSGARVARSVLWPFFSWRFNADTDYRDVIAPWPFFRWLRSRTADETKLWPLLGRYEQKDKGQVEWTFLWPIGSYHVWDDRIRNFEKKSLWLLPLYWDHRKTYKVDGSRERYTHLWPLFHRKTGRDGSVEHALLSPWWFIDQEPFGFRDNYDPLLTLYYLRDEPARGEALVSFLGPLFRWHRTKRGADLRLLAFRWGRQGEGDVARRGWSLLEGLVGYEDDAGRKTLRLLWFPLRWGQSRLPRGEAGR